MPNRVDGNINGLRPTLAVRPEARQNDQVEQQANRPEQTQQRDRVEISELARQRAEEARPRAGAGDDSRAGAAERPDARPPEAGQQGAVNGPTAQRAEQVREQREAAVRVAAESPAERQGNLVDVVG